MIIRFAVTLLATSLALHADPLTDRSIERAALSSYMLRGVLKNQVRVRAENGVVTLTGSVLDRDQRALAADAVRHLPGVVAIDNRVEVITPGPERGDGWIALQLRSLLIVRREISARNTDVSVQDGVVTLIGTAENEEQRRLTEACAREIAGVKSVRNLLQISGQAANSAGAPPDDPRLIARVSAALLSDPVTNRARVSVECLRGVVTLRGRVTSEAEKQRAFELAASEPGVTSVVDELTVEAVE